MRGRQSQKSRNVVEQKLDYLKRKQFDRVKAKDTWVSSLPRCATMDLPFRLAFLFLVILYASLVQSQSSTPTSTGPSVLTQPIVHPTRGDIIEPGSTFTIKWEQNDHFQNVTLQLWDKTSWGYSRDLAGACDPWGGNPFCGNIASHAPNTGSFDWQVPDPANGTLGFGFPRGERVFWVKLYVEDYVKEDINNKDPVLAYSSNFAFAKDGEPGTTVSEPMTSTSLEGDSPGTVFVTVYDSTTAGVGMTATGTGPTVSVTATRAPAKNDTAPSLAEGKASRPGRSVVSALLLMLGLL